MSARDGAVSITDKHGRLVMPPKPKLGMDTRTHRHACGHYDACFLPQFAETTDCRRCATARFNLQATRERQ